MGNDRARIQLPDGLADRVDEYFGQASNTWTGTVVAALWYAVERYEAEHGIDRAPTHDDVPDDET